MGESGVLSRQEIPERLKLNYGRSLIFQCSGERQIQTTQILHLV